MKTRNSALIRVIATAGFGVAAGFLAPGDAEAASWHNCQPTAVFETAGQFQVSCSNGWAQDPTVTWIAINLADYTADQENRFWSAATSSLLSGRQFRVYLTDTNCGFATCRLATSWSIYTF